MESEYFRIFGLPSKGTPERGHLEKCGVLVRHLPYDWKAPSEFDIGYRYRMLTTGVIGASIHKVNGQLVRVWQEGILIFDPSRVKTSTWLVADLEDPTEKNMLKEKVQSQGWGLVESDSDRVVGYRYYRQDS